MVSRVRRAGGGEGDRSPSFHLGRRARVLTLTPPPVDNLAMMCHHCSPSDFDEIPSLLGASYSSFSSSSLAPYFLKSQSHVESPSWPLRRAGTQTQAAEGDGPVKTGFSWINDLCAAFVRSCGKLGMQVRGDVNDTSEGLGTMGVSRTKTFIHQGCELLRNAVIIPLAELTAPPPLDDG